MLTITHSKKYASKKFLIFLKKILFLKKNVWNSYKMKQRIVKNVTKYKIS